MEAKKYKVLQIIPDLGCNGAQSWLYRMLKYLDSERFQMDFFLRDENPKLFVDRFKMLGAGIFSASGQSGGRRGRLGHFDCVRNTMIQNGPYDVVQSHEGLNSGPVFLIAKQLGVPMRIVHAHSVEGAKSRSLFPISLGAEWTKKKLIARYATHGFASSSKSASAMFGPNWVEDNRWQTFFCGIDLAPFFIPADGTTHRNALGIPGNALVVGHVGQLSMRKNPLRLVDIFSKIVSRAPGARLLLVGGGPLCKTIEAKAARLGIRDRVILTGLRTDASELMRDVMDVFVFPSESEGLGLAFVEAQAAGLPCVVSDTIPKDADVIHQRITRLSLTEPDTVWAKAVLDAAFRGRVSFNPVLFGRFDIKRSVKSWETIYSHASSWGL